MSVINMKCILVAALGLVLSATAYQGDLEVASGIPAGVIVPVGCAAALKCTPIEFCTAQGMISNTSVVLSREQNIYRVPITDCRDPQSGILGKCCRDPYYTDPWPVNQIGKWVPGVFGGEDGKYKTGEIIEDQFTKPKKPAKAVQVGLGQIGLVGQGEILQVGAGQIVKPGKEVTVAQVEQGQIVKQGGGAIEVVQGGGQYVVPGEEITVSQGGGAFGVVQGGGSYVKPGKEITVSQGGGAFGVVQGGGSYVKPGEEITVSQGGGAFGVVQGGGSYVKPGKEITVSQGGGAYEVVQGGGQYVIPGEEITVSQGGGGYGVVQGEGQYVQQGVGQYLVQGIGTAYQQTLYRVFLQPYFAGAQCGLLNNQIPLGNRNELEADFAEYPWQAMVLEKTNKSLLCGGVITRPDVVITSASCVDGLKAENILIKGGEWKLGVDEEPLPFQIVQAKTVLFHPFYQSGTYQYDVAILVLSENLRFAKNIYPICLPTAQESFEALYSESGECVVTGWGKEVLQAHRLGSIMHDLNVTLINPIECQARISKYYPKLLEYYNKDSSACATPNNPLNNICSVDIGSALACPTKDGHYVLKGVYSWDSGCRQLGNQIGAFYKFDVEWYEWALGLIESGRFAQFAKGALFAGAEGKIKVEGEGLGIKQEALELGQAGAGLLTGQGAGLLTGQGAGLLAGQTFTYQTKPEIISYTTKPEIISYTTKPEIITYTTKPEIITYTTKPKIITYTTKPKIVTYTTKPKIVTYTTKPKIITYTTKPEIITYTTKPEIVSYTTKPQIFTYATEPKVVSFATKPQYTSFVSEPQFITSGVRQEEGSYIPDRK